MATDQEIRDSGLKYLPQQKYLQNPYELPVEEEVTESFGIPNTNAFNNSGGNDFSVYNPDPNSIVNRDYRPNYDYRRFSEYDSDPSTKDIKQMDINQNYFYGPPPSKLQSLMSMVPGAGIARFLTNAIAPYTPVNRRSIMENELGRKGVMVNDIGQIVQGGGAYDTAGNVMAGYNPTKMTAATFDKRIANIQKTLDKKYGSKNYKGDKTKLDERVEALKEAKKKFLDIGDESDEIYNFEKKQKIIQREKTALGRSMNQRDRKSLAEQQINPDGPSSSRRGTPGGSADNFNNGMNYDNSRGDFRNADGSNVNQNFSTTAGVSNYDPSVLYADGGRVGYFFGGRARLQGGGGADMGAEDKAEERSSKGYGAAPDTGSKSGTNDYSSFEQNVNHQRAMRDNQREKPSTLDNVMNLGSEVNYLKNLYKMDPIGLGIGFGVNKLRTYIKNKNLPEEDKLSYNTNPLPTDNYFTEVQQKDLDASKMRGFKKQDYNSYLDQMNMLNDGTKVTPYEFQGLQDGSITTTGAFTAANGGRAMFKNGGLASIL